MKFDKKRLVAVILGLLILASGAVAYNAVFTAGSGTSYETGSGLVVSTSVDHNMSDQNPFNSSSTLYVSGVEFTASGSAKVTVDQFRGTTTSVSSINASTNTITINPDDKSFVAVSGGVTALSWEDARIDGSAQMTYSASSSGTVDVSGLASNTTYAAATTSTEVFTVGETTTDGKATIQVDAATNDDVVLLKPSTPTLGSASPTGGQTFNDEHVETSIQVNDSDFATDAGDEIKVDFYLDGSQFSSKNITQNGTVTFNASNLGNGSHSWHVETTDAYGSTNTSSTYSFEVVHHPPDFDNANATPRDGYKTSNREVTLSVPINDSDFAETSGDTLTVNISMDGNVLKSQQITSNGTVSTTVTVSTGGEHTWHAKATDEYNQTTVTDSDTTDSDADPFTFQAPSELRVYNESNPQQKIDSVTVKLRFYGQSGDTDFVVERDTNNGTINMTELPADQEFVVIARAPNYYNRRIYVPSLYQQEQIYLLNQSKKAVYNVFQLRDQSGNYPTGDTRIVVKRAINASGDGLEWTTITGDYFGATNEHPTNLRFEERYRIIVANTDGDRRVIGAYMATDEANPKVITINSIVVSPPQGQQYYGTAWLSREDPNPENNVTERTLRFSYNDPANDTTSFDLTIHERGNTSNVLAKVHTDDVGTSWAYTRTLEGNETEKSWVVNWTAQRNGNTIGQKFPVGNRGNIPIPMDPEWLARFALVALPIVAALASERIATLGAMGVVAFAGILMVAGIWPIPVLLWFAALIIAVGGHALTMARRGSVFG